jgi:hypothetical protein
VATDLAALTGAVTSAAADLEGSFADGVRDGELRSTLDGLLALIPPVSGSRSLVWRVSASESMC